MTPVVLQVRVPPRHCDAQGMMHAARPYEYFEDAFLAWLDRECGGYESVRAGGHDFVIVQSQCEYLEPARLGDRIDLRVLPVGVGKRSSFTIGFEMAREGVVLAKGLVTYVTVREGRSSEIPGTLRQVLHAPGGLFAPCDAGRATEPEIAGNADRHWRRHAGCDGGLVPRLTASEGRPRGPPSLGPAASARIRTRTRNAITGAADDDRHAGHQNALSQHFRILTYRPAGHPRDMDRDCVVHRG